MTKESVLKEFIALNGVGKAKAELLYAKGITSKEKLQKTTVEELTKIKGITEKNANDILKQVQKPQTKPKTPAPVKKTTSKKPTTPKKTTKTEDEKQKPAPKKPEEPVEIIEEDNDAYTVKIKPKLSPRQQQQLQTRRQIKKRTPAFLREEWFRYKRIPKNWRRPDGLTSKMRINLKYRPSKARVGFRGPKEVRGLHASGFEEVLIHNIADLVQINPEKQAARIGGTVGTKKRLELAKKAAELNIRILNMKV